jgi:hypothetical protein
VSKGEGLRKELLSKTHHYLYTVHSESIKMYKDDERLGLEFSTYLSSSSLQATFGCRLMKHFMSPLYRDNIGRDNVGRKQCWSLK